MSLLGLNEPAAQAFAEWLLDDELDPMYLDYLDGLHAAGVKMTKAGKYLQREFGMSKSESRMYVLEWITTTDYDFEEE